MRLNEIAARYPIFRVCKGTLVLALTLYSSFAVAQSLPDSAAAPGDQSNIDCSDPSNSTYPQCADTANQRPNAQTQQGYGTGAPQSPTQDSGSQLNNRTYSDDGGLNAATARNRRQALGPLEPPEPLSEFQKFVSATTGQVLPIFGASLFENAPSTFAPVDQVPVTADYVLGPGDELRIRVWGQINFNAALRIDRSGNIYLPQVGAVHVAGLPYASLQEHIRSEIGHVFRNFNVTVDLGQLRSIQVFVVGQARHPGSYTVSSLSTMINAIFASGGPSAQGSLRRIQLKRQGSIITQLDLYDLLLRGDKSKDAPLLPGDVIFIPAAGSQVALTGSVRKPAIYELATASTLGQLLQEAGGASPLAATARVSIERLQDHADRAAMEVALDATGLNTPLRDGDLLRVLSVVPAYEKTVILRGNLANPGRFAWHEGMRLSALIPDRASLVTRNYWWQRTRLGLPAPEFEPYVTGPIQNQTRYPIDLQSLPCPVHAPANTEDPSKSTMQDPNADPPCTPTRVYQMGTALPGQPGQQGPKQGAPAQVNQARSSGSSASLASESNRPDTFRPDTTRTEVKLSAPEIDWNYAVIERMDPLTLKTSLIPFNLGHLVMDHDTSQDLELKSGDVVSIFSQADIRVPSSEQTKFVHLEGEFAGAGIYSVKPGETLRQLVMRAGGLTPQAYLYGSEFTRESTRILQQQRIEEYVRSLELQIERGSIAAASSGSASSGDVASANAVVANERELTSRLEQIRATGRIVLNLNPDAAGLDLLPDLPLEDGDRFIVPQTPSHINVIGAVYDQNSFLFQPGRTVRDYLHQSGGPNRDADRKRTFVIRADGSVISRASRSSGQFNSARLNPGDTIVVPEKTFRPSNLRGLIEYTQIFSQLALGAAAIGVLQ